MYRVSNDKTPRFNPKKTPQEPLYTACRRMCNDIENGADPERSAVLAGTGRNIAFFSGWTKKVCALSQATADERSQIENFNMGLKG